MKKSGGEGLNERIALGSETRRVEVGSGVMLYDASRAGNLTPSWFEVDYWRGRDALVGQAGGRGTTWFAATPDLGIALRHYRRGGLIAKLSEDRYLYLGDAKTRPMHEWRLTYQLHRAGLPVPAPLGARYQRDGLLYRGDLITERIEDSRSVAQRLRDASLPLSDWIALGRCIRRFHDFGLCHADLNAHNILRRGDGEIFLIDFDRGSLRPRGMWCDANLVRLRRSLLKVTLGLPEGTFSETDWHSVLAGYWQGAGNGGPSPAH